MPITAHAQLAIKAQCEGSGDSAYLFRSIRENTAKPYSSNINKTWTATLRRAGIPRFSLDELRHTFATDDPVVFGQLDRRANERVESFGKATQN